MFESMDLESLRDKKRRKEYHNWLNMHGYVMDLNIRQYLFKARCEREGKLSGRTVTLEIREQRSGCSSVSDIVFERDLH